MSRCKSPELDHITLEAALERGSPAAFERLYVRYADKVRYSVARAAYRRQCPREVDELYQEVWCRLLDNERRLLRRYDPQRGAFGPFLGTVAYQQALVCASRCQSRPTPEEDVGGEQLIDDESLRFAEALIQGELCRKLLARVEEDLSDDDRRLLQELYLELRTCRSVAEELGISENAVYKRNERLKKRLARIVDDLVRAPVSSGHPRLSAVAALSLVVLALVTQDPGVTGAADVDPNEEMSR